MKELSLNILDIAENSIAANASIVTIVVTEKINDNILNINIEDNGKGMDKEFLKTVTNPFSTTRKTRKVGMGISLLKMLSEQSNGKFEISSELGVGTIVNASFEHNHIDRPPLGNIEQTISVLVSCNLDVDFVYKHIYNDNRFKFDTREVKRFVQGIQLNNSDTILWIQEYIRDGILGISS